MDKASHTERGAESNRVQRGPKVTQICCFPQAMERRVSDTVEAFAGLDWSNGSVAPCVLYGYPFWAMGWV